MAGNSFYTYQSIDPAECIGDSVYKINNNNKFAADAIGDLETRIVLANIFIAPTNPYTITASDIGKTILTDFSVANTINLPGSLSTGFQINVIQIGTGQTTFAATGGTTLCQPDNFTKIYKRWSSASAVFVGSNNWVLIGDLIS